jgi:hypothetical protein
VITIVLMIFILLLMLMLLPAQWLQRLGASMTLALFLALALLVPADSLPPSL